MRKHHGAWQPAGVLRGHRRAPALGGNLKVVVGDTALTYPDPGHPNSLHHQWCDRQQRSPYMLVPSPDAAAALRPWGQAQRRWQQQQDGAPWPQGRTAPLWGENG